MSPKTCLLTVTNSCVLRCKMCNLWQLNTSEREIDLDDMKRFVDSLAVFDSSPLEVHLIGGESLIKNGILDLIRYISGKGSRTVITSCGYTIDEETAQRLVDAGLSMLNLSLDSLDPAVHNFLRGKADSHQRLMRAIDHLAHCKKNKLRLGINTVMSAYNLDGIIELAEWVERNDALESIYFMAVMRPFGAPVDWQWYEKKEYAWLWPQDAKKVDYVLDRLIDLKQGGCNKIENACGQLRDFKSYFHAPGTFVKDRRCNLTHHAINVNAVGDVYLCFFMEPLGNIRSADIHELWSSPAAANIRNKMTRCTQNCELAINCYYGE